MPNWGHTNQLFYVLALPFAHMLGSDSTCRLLLAASVAATVLASARLCDHVGASRWFSLLSAPLALGWTFFHGFAPNVLGFASFLFALPYLDDFARAPSPRGALLSVGMIALLHFAHETSAACGCAAVVVLSLGASRRPPDLLLLALPELAGALLYLLETRLERSVVTPFAHRFLEAGIQMHPPLKKVAYAAHCLLGPFAVEEEALVLGLVTLALVAGWREEARSGRPHGSRGSCGTALRSLPRSSSPASSRCPPPSTSAGSSTCGSSRPPT